MNIVAFGIGVLGTAMGILAAFYQRYGYFGAKIGGPYAATVAVAAVGLVAAVLLLLKRFRTGAWVSLFACIAGAFTSFDLWLAPGSFFLASCLIGFTTRQSALSSMDAGAGNPEVGGAGDVDRKRGPLP